MPDESNEVRPFPPRYRWLKRLALLGLLGLLGLVGLRLWWGWYAERVFEAKVAALQAAGHRVTPEDFAVEALPDAENAALLLMDAVAAIDPGTNRPFSLQDAFDYPALRERAPAIVEQHLAANRPVFDLIDQVRATPRADWSSLRKQGTFNPGFTYLSGLRELAKLLCVDAARAMQADDPARAVGRLRDQLMISARLRQGYLPLTDNLVAIAIDGLATSTTALLLCEPPQIDPAVRREIEETITMLLDETEIRAADRRVFDSECNWAYLAADDPLAALGGGMAVPGGVLARIQQAALGPVFRLDAVRQLAILTSYGDAVLQPTLPNARTDVKSVLGVETGTELTARIISRVTIPSWERVGELCFHNYAGRRCAAAALAALLYRADEGRWPADLDALVPTYLEAVPLDPFASPPATLQYALEPEGPAIFVSDPDGRVRIDCSPPPRAEIPDKILKALEAGAGRP